MLAVEKDIQKLPFGSCKYMQSLSVASNCLLKSTMGKLNNKYNCNKGLFYKNKIKPIIILYSSLLI